MDLEDFKNLNIDKSDWQPVKFGDVVKEIRESVKDPASQDIDRIVGLEHIEPENIHLENWDSIVNGTTFTRRFRKGQVLFGRRRAYLKKAALAEFDGVCSGDIIVMEAKEKLNPKLLPFIVNNDNFFDYAVKTSAGSLSPRTKFQYLAEYEFLLPPKDQQEKIAELLWAANRVIEVNLQLYEKTKNYFERYLIESMRGKFSPDSSLWKEYTLSQLGETYSGLNGKTKNDFGNGKPFITYMNIFSNLEINTNAFELVQIDGDEKQNKVAFGDIFFTASSETPDEVGMSSVLLEEIEECYLNSFCIGFRLKDFSSLDPFFAKYLFRSLQVRKFMRRHAQGSTRFNLSKTTLKNKLQLKIPPIEEQKYLYEKLESIQKIMKRISNQIERVKFIQKSLIERIFVNQ
jgi:type I restriction enzyme S subunit